jgi:hypothetical protein
MRGAASPLLALALIASLGCPSNAPTSPAEADTNLLLSAINVSDPAAADQLINGFYLVEQGGWRWTAKTFAVSFPTPPTVAEHPALLSLHFTIPNVIINTLGPITLTTRVNGNQVDSHRYDQPGFRLRQDVEIPEALLTESPTRVEFELDKTLDDQTSSKFEVGIVVESVSLQ